MLTSPRDTSTSHKFTKMRRYNIVSRVLLILSVTNIALAAPVLVQENHPACVDVVHVPMNVITVLGKRMDEYVRLIEDFERSGLLHYERPEDPPSESSSEHGSQPNSELGSQPNSEHSSQPSSESSSEHGSMESHTSILSIPLSWNPDRESMYVDTDAPAPSQKSSTESEYSHTPSSSPEWSTESEHWHTPPSEHWHTPPSSLGSSTESDSDSDRWSTISNAPSTESQFENLQAVDQELKGKAKVERRISGTARVL